MVYVSDYGNHRIQKFTPEGNVLAVIDNKETRDSFSPYGLCIDSNNILYVADRDNNTVCVYNHSIDSYSLPLSETMKRGVSKLLPSLLPMYPRNCPLVLYTHTVLLSLSAT